MQGTARRDEAHPVAPAQAGQMRLAGSPVELADLPRKRTLAVWRGSRADG